MQTMQTETPQPPPTRPTEPAPDPTHVRLDPEAAQALDFAPAGAVLVVPHPRPAEATAPEAAGPRD